MILRIPDFYDSFHCLGAACPDNCCIGSELDIDEDTYEYYKSVPGEFGDRLRRGIADAADAGKSQDVLGDGSDARRSFKLEIGGRCPFLNRKNLCDIVLHLGEEALCRVCTDYPRYTFEWAGRTEKSLTLSCPEAGRLMFLNDIPISFKEIELQDEGLSSYMEEDYDESVAALPGDAEFEDNWDEEQEDIVYAGHISEVRDTCFRILQDRRYPLENRVEAFLALCGEVQELIDKSYPEPEPLTQPDSPAQESDPDLLDRELPEMMASCMAAMNVFSVHAFAVDEKAYKKRLELLAKLEVISDRWTKTLEAAKSVLSTDYARCLQDWQSSPDFNEVHYEHLLVYFTFRYFPLAAYDYSLIDKALFAVFGTLTIRDLDAARYAISGGSFSFTDRIQTVAEFSREVEHSDFNIEMLCGELSLGQ